MESFNERLKRKLDNVAFCYAKEGKQGFVDKETCACYVSGCSGLEKNCNAYHEYMDFKETYDRISNEGHPPETDIVNLTVAELASKYDWQTTEWFKHNLTFAYERYLENGGKFYGGK